ncbi:hypothetical protein [Flavobacterium sp. U410]
MIKPNTYNNLKIIFNESYRWRNSDLSSDGTDREFTFFSKTNLCIILIAITISLVNSDINDTVLNAILTFASIYSSLIIPVIIMVYDKYIQNPVNNLTEIQQKSEGAKLRVKIFKNFTSRFVFTALETVIIAIFIIIIILFYKSCSYSKININIWDYQFVKLNKESFFIFLDLFFNQCGKIFFLTMMVRFLWFIFFSIGALGDFFKSGLNE